MNDIENILDYNAINIKYWRDERDLDMKRRKEAEFLVMGDIQKTAVIGFVVYNKTAKKELIKIGVDDSNVHIKTESYF